MSHHTEAAPAHLLGPGALVLVVGPSGAGKDTLLAVAQDLLSDHPRVQFARRLVTRPAGAHEDHASLSEAEFAAQRPEFALWWEAHGLFYALGREVVQAIRAGDTVVANGSRATLPLARERFARLFVVHITAPIAVRAQRLALRGREDLSAITARLERAPPLTSEPDLELENTGSPQAGGARLAAFIAALGQP